MQEEPDQELRLQPLAHPSCLGEILRPHKQAKQLVFRLLEKSQTQSSHDPKEG